MSAKGELLIHVAYGSSTGLVVASQQDFLKKVCEKYNLKEDEIEILNIMDKGFIGADELKDGMLVEIKKKKSCALNGRSNSPESSLLKEPNRSEIVQKLLGNQALTGKERAYLVNLLEDTCEPPLKRIKEEYPVQHQTMNDKDAANSIAKKTASTQTDEFISNLKPSLNTSITVNDIMSQSKMLATVDRMDAAIATELMMKSFIKRRNFILIERPMARFVKEKYPLLFSNEEVQNEIDRIFYDGKCLEFFENIRKCAPHILKIATDDDPLLLTTKDKMAAAETDVQRKYAEEVGAILMISSHMQEKRNFLKLVDNSCNPGDFPYIECQAKQNDLYSDVHVFKIFVEGILLCEASDFKEAILCLIASFFIFNITYPLVNFNTFVTFEKLFLEANDTQENDIRPNVLQIIQSIQLLNRKQSHVKD